MPKFTRRSFLETGAKASALVTLWAAGCAPTETPSEAEPTWENPGLDADQDGATAGDNPTALPVAADGIFPIGVQSGDPDQSGAIVLTQAVGLGGAALGVKVWRMADDVALIAIDTTLEPQDDMEAPTQRVYKARLDGLAPGTRYAYCFVTPDGTRSRVGQLTTAFPEGYIAPLRVATVTCTNPRHAPYEALSGMAAAEPDVTVHLGDMVYADGSVSLADYRSVWRAQLGHEGYQALLAAAPIVATWDDHEVDNNFNPESTDPDQLAAAIQAHEEHVALERTDGNLWRSVRYGAAVEFIVLDCRTERRPSLREESHEAYISAAQLAFVTERLKSSPAAFKVVLNSVPMCAMPGNLWGAQNDRWQGYERARDVLLDTVRQHADGVLFLSGDFHLGFVGLVEPEAGLDSLYEIAVGPSGNLGNPLGLLAENEAYKEQVFPAAQFKYGRGKIAGTLLDFDPSAGTVRVRYTAADGETLFDESLTIATPRGRVV